MESIGARGISVWSFEKKKKERKKERKKGRKETVVAQQSERKKERMANTAHLVRRQSSRDLKPQKSVDKLEMKEMRGRLVVDNRKTNTTANYGATNAAFEDSSPNMKVITSIYKYIFIYIILQHETSNFCVEYLIAEQSGERGWG